MNEIPQVSGVPSHLLSEESELPKAKSAFGKDDFMKLLMTQLQHQDPLNPMDHREFSAQLAQFSSLEQLQNIGQGIQGLKGEMGNDQKLQAMGFIGKRVEATGGELEFRENVAAKVLSSGADSANRALVFDASGQPVRELRNDGKAGDLIWDGKDSNGREVALGKYQFRLFKTMPDGQEKEMGSDVGGKVTGVDLDGKTPVLLVDSGHGVQRMDLAKVRSVQLEPAPILPLPGAKTDDKKPETKPATVQAPDPQFLAKALAQAAAAAGGAEGDE